MLATRFASPKKREVMLLARSLMRKSMTFWSALCNWIDEIYGKLTSKTEAQKPGGGASLVERKEYDTTLASVCEEAWRLVLNILTDIFQELALRRANNCEFYFTASPSPCGGSAPGVDPFERQSHCWQARMRRDL
jgi:hypothetical protein